MIIVATQGAAAAPAAAALGSAAASSCKDKSSDDKRPPVNKAGNVRFESDDQQDFFEDETSATIRSNEPLNLPRNNSPLPIKTISDQIRSEEIKSLLRKREL